MRAIAAGLTPALNDARMRFRCSLRNLVNPSDLVIADSRRLASRGCPGRRSRCGFVLGTALIAAIDLDGNGREQPLELDVVEVLQ